VTPNLIIPYLEALSEERREGGSTSIRWPFYFEEEIKKEREIKKNKKKTPRKASLQTSFILPFLKKYSRSLFIILNFSSFLLFYLLSISPFIRGNI